MPTGVALRFHWLGSGQAKINEAAVRDQGRWGKSSTIRTMGSRGRHWKVAFAYAVSIGVLGGLIGLGGAEFRLPILAGPLRYSTPYQVEG